MTINVDSGSVQQSGTVSMAQKRRSLRASMAGNTLEWYEWTTYSVLSPFIATILFDPNDPAAGLLAVFGVFAVGFLMRPIGGIVFGIVGDRFGRRTVLLITMLSMALASFAIGMLPTFEAIGIWSSILLLLFRLIQGFAHGGESTAILTYIGEIAPPNRRGLWGSVSGVALMGGTVLAFLISAILVSILGEDGVAAWGWRIPFLLGGVLALVVLWMRRSMHESEVFEDQTAVDTKDAPRVPRRRVVFLTVRLIAFISGLTCFNYVWMSYMTTYAISEQGMPTDTAYWATMFGQLVCIAATPFLGLLSDKIGRKPMMWGFAALAFIVTVPFTMLVGTEPWTLFVTVALALVIWSMSNSLMPALNSENFPTHMRGRGVGFAFSLSVALFGGTAPYLNQLFVNLGQAWMFNAYVMTLCGISFIATFFFKETRGMELDDERIGT